MDDYLINSAPNIFCNNNYSIIKSANFTYNFHSYQTIKLKK